MWKESSRTWPFPQIKPGFCFNCIYPNTKTFSKISLWSELTVLQVFHPTGHALAATTRTVTPHRDVDAATNTTMGCCGGMCSSSSRGWQQQSIQDATIPGHKEDHECLTQWTAIVSLTFTDDTPGVAHINLGTEPRLTTKHPNPEAKLFFLATTPRQCRRCLHHKWTIFRLPLAAGSCTNPTPCQLIISSYCL